MLLIIIELQLRALYIETVSEIDVTFIKVLTMSGYKFFVVLIFAALVSFYGCRQASKQVVQPSGKLFIIGGGHKPNSLIEKLIEVAQPGIDDYAVVLPMSSAMPDTAAFYGVKMFNAVNFKNVYAILPDSMHGFSNEDINRIKGARIIYITGGDQNKFMQCIAGTHIQQIISDAYKSGATIAGTSAGAAVMSKKMLTGDQLKYPVYTGDFPTIESSNIEISEGLGLLPEAIVDQHFIKRQRMNRLMAVCLENPNELAIGIDESTAIVVDGNTASVVGESQVITMKHQNAETKIVNGLLGGKDIQLSIYLPGDSFLIIE